MRRFKPIQVRQLPVRLVHQSVAEAFFASLKSRGQVAGVHSMKTPKGARAVVLPEPTAVPMSVNVRFPDLPQQRLICRGLTQQAASELAQTVHRFVGQFEAGRKVHEVVPFLRVGDCIEAHVDCAEADLLHRCFGIHFVHSGEAPFGHFQPTLVGPALRNVLQQLD